ncbi:MAG: hypothetical protein LBV07_03055, partial [Syntrophobacterales bacterium]|nr:hypothetical protein [Syntrophobacterales bacterium]
MPSLKEQLSIIDEAYLAGISNKGIVNRAQKDLADSGISFILNDSALEASFADGTAVKINGAPGNFQCSCPSRTICKHVIMALIKASESFREPLAASSGSFDYLLAYNQDTLVKVFGKTAYNDVLFKIMSGEICEIEEGSILVIKMMTSAFIVRFLPGATLAESVCSCKTKNCRHRLEAVIQYIRHKAGKLEFELIREDSDVGMEVIPHVISFIEDIFRAGLTRLPVEYAEKCGQFAVLCHGAGFAFFERLFKVCGGELALYEQKSAAFNKNRLLRNLTRIYQMCGEIQRGGNEKAAALAGKFKRQYMELPKFRVMGLGAYPWHAKSGFCGVTAVFYAPDLKQTFTFTSSRPVESEKEAQTGIEQTWHSKSAWNLPLRFGVIAKGELSLLGAKISEDFRLSSSENTTAYLIKPQTELGVGWPGSDEGGVMVFDDFTQIKNLFSSDPDSPRMAYAVLKTSNLGEGSFNRVTQTCSVQIIDKFGNSLSLTIAYAKINETAILNFEYLAKNN